MWRMKLIWMLVRTAFGVIDTRGVFWFNLSAFSYRNTAVASLYRWLEREKQRRHEQRVWEIEMGSFTPSVFSTFGGMGDAATSMNKRLASLLSAMRDQSYGLVMSWLHCSLNFSLLWSTITCLCATRSIRGSPVVIGALDLTTSEGQVLHSH